MLHPDEPVTSILAFNAAGIAEKLHISPERREERSAIAILVQEVAKQWGERKGPNAAIRAEVVETVTDGLQFRYDKLEQYCGEDMPRMDPAIQRAFYIALACGPYIDDLIASGKETPPPFNDDSLGLAGMFYNEAMDLYLKGPEKAGDVEVESRIVAHIMGMETVSEFEANMARLSHQQIAEFYLQTIPKIEQFSEEDTDMGEDLLDYIDCIKGQIRRYEIVNRVKFLPHPANEP